MKIKFSSSKNSEKNSVTNSNNDDEETMSVFDVDKNIEEYFHSLSLR